MDRTDYETGKSTEELIRTIHELRAAVEQRDQIINEKQHLLEQTQQTLSVLQQMLFGPRSERVTASKTKNDQAYLFNEAEVQAGSTLEENESPGNLDQASTQTKSPRKKAKNSGRRRPSGEIERVEVIHDLPEDEAACGWCNTERPVIGKEVSEEIEVIPQKIVVKVHVKIKRGPCTCDDFIGHDEQSVITARGPVRIAPGSLYSNTTAAFIIANKFVDALPFYRQEAQFERMGLRCGRGTMARLIIRIAKELKPLLECLKADIQSSPVVGMDETVLQVLKEPDRAATTQSRMWVARGYHDSGGTARPIVWFEYHDSRSGDVAEAMISNFKGYLQTDGYQGYARVGKRDGMTHVGCWAHIRREFHRLYESDQATPIAADALRLIKKIYKIEKTFRNELDLGSLTREQFCERRKTEVAPVFQEILVWLHARQIEVPPQSVLGKAISYALGQYRRAIRYVDHWLLTPDNNPVENAIRPFVIGRKNWLFADTPAGARVSACLYSLIECAKANGHEPFAYLCHLFSTYPTVKTDQAALANLLPHRLDPKVCQAATTG